MGQALLHSDPSSSQVLKASDGERKGWVLGVDHMEESSSVFALQVVDLLHFSLKHGSTNVSLPWHTFSRGHVHVQSKDVSWSEFPVIDSLFWSFLVDDGFVSVVKVLLHFVREDSLDWVDLVLIAHLLDGGGNVLVETSNLEGSSGSEESIVSSENSVGLLSLGLASNNDGVSSVGRVPVHVGSQLNLDQVFVLELDRVFGAW